MFDYKNIATKLNITQTQAKSRLKKAGYKTTEKFNEEKFKQVLIELTPLKQLQAETIEQNQESPTQDSPTQVETEKVYTLKELASDDLPIDKLLEMAQALDLNVGAISQEDTTLLLDLTRESIQLEAIHNQANQVANQREKIRKEKFRQELARSEQNAELDALIIHKLGEMTFEQTLLELESKDLQKLEGKKRDFAAELEDLVNRTSQKVIDVEVTEQRQLPFSQEANVRVKMLRGL